MGFGNFNTERNIRRSELVKRLADVDQDLMVDDVSGHAYLTDSQLEECQKQKEVLLALIDEIDQEIQKENDIYDSLEV